MANAADINEQFSVIQYSWTGDLVLCLDCLCLGELVQIVARRGEAIEGHLCGLVDLLVRRVSLVGRAID